jgi:hypothetical protein
VHIQAFIFCKILNPGSFSAKSGWDSQLVKTPQIKLEFQAGSPPTFFGYHSNIENELTKPQNLVST